MVAVSSWDSPLRELSRGMRACDGMLFDFLGCSFPFPVGFTGADFSGVRLVLALVGALDVALETFFGGFKFVISKLRFCILRGISLLQ